MENEKVCPKTWMAESILVTLFCCLPFGIIGIINAAKVSSLFASGQADAAMQASKSAGKWTKIGFFLGIACCILYILCVALFGISMGSCMR